MKKSLIYVAVLGVCGCTNLGYHNMTVEQIKATAGTTTCTQYTGLYGKASTIALNQDETRKGSSSDSEITIACGDASMTIKGRVIPGAPK